jgi:integrase
MGARPPAGHRDLALEDAAPLAPGVADLPRFVVDALAERLAGPGTAEELVFAGPPGGALRVTLFRQRFWLPAVKAAGLDGLRIHDLRHTAEADRECLRPQRGPSGI